MIDAAFWASLRREEGLRAEDLARLRDARGDRVPAGVRAPRAARAGRADPAGAGGRAAGHSPGRGARRRASCAVWGTVRTIPKYCCVVEVSEPGLLVVKHHRGEVQAKFVNVAVLQGDQVKVIDEHASSLPDCPSLLTSLLGFDSPATWAGSSTCWCSSRCRCGRTAAAGLLLVVPGGIGGVAGIDRAAARLRGRRRRSRSWRC